MSERRTVAEEINIKGGEIIEEISERILKFIREFNKRGENISQDIIRKLFKGEIPLHKIRPVIRQLVKEGVLKEEHKTEGHGRPIYLSIAIPDDETTVNQKLNVVLEYLVTIMNRDDKKIKALIRIEEAIRILILERKR